MINYSYKDIDGKNHLSDLLFVQKIYKTYDLNKLLDFNKLVSIESENDNKYRINVIEEIEKLSKSFKPHITSTYGKNVLSLTSSIVCMKNCFNELLFNIEEFHKDRYEFFFGENIEVLKKVLKKQNYSNKELEEIHNFIKDIMFLSGETKKTYADNPYGSKTYNIYSYNTLQNKIREYILNDKEYYNIRYYNSLKESKDNKEVNLYLEYTNTINRVKQSKYNNINFLSTLLILTEKQTKQEEVLNNFVESILVNYRKQDYC